MVVDFISCEPVQGLHAGIAQDLADLAKDKRRQGNHMIGIQRQCVDDFARGAIRSFRRANEDGRIERDNHSARCRTCVHALRNLVSEADTILKTAPSLPENRTTAARDLLGAAAALFEDFIEQSSLSPAASLGSKGGTETARRFGSGHFRQLAARRKTRAGGDRAKLPNS